MWGPDPFAMLEGLQVPPASAAAAAAAAPPQAAQGLMGLDAIYRAPSAASSAAAMQPHAAAASPWPPTSAMGVQAPSASVMDLMGASLGLAA